MVDNGRGITSEEHDGLFKMFGKLRRTAEQNSEGIGMGLMICKQLVEANRGSIKVFSEGENKGARFVFTMAMKQEKENPTSYDTDLKKLSGCLENHSKKDDEMRISQEEKMLLSTVKAAISQSSSSKMLQM